MNAAAHTPDSPLTGDPATRGAAAPAGVRAAPRPRAPAGDIPTLDWQGRPVNCARCPHLTLREEGGCEPGHSCMQDAYARRIDRFFRAHPRLAVQHLEHPYFEVRAIAARHADLFHISVMREDPDETVRMQVALRVPQRQLLAMCDDPHREVRIRVAQRIDQANLNRMVGDADYEVRKIVARRLPQALLPLMAGDVDEQVRRVVAERLDMPALWRLAADRAPGVRRIVAQRAPLPLLPTFAADEDWAVRWAVADRIELPAHTALLRTLAQDSDTEVRARAAERLAERAQPLIPLSGESHG
jgi:hypothetical protein